jgi:hypothetical protein
MAALISASDFSAGITTMAAIASPAKKNSGSR